MAKNDRSGGELAYGLPECVRQVKEYSDALVKAVNDSSFPDIQADPATAIDVALTIKDVAAWARRIDRAYGLASTRPRRDAGLCGLFGPNLTMEEEKKYIPSLSWARDIFGPVPSELRDSCALPILHMNPDKQSHMLSVRTGKRLAYTVANWKEIRTVLETAQIVLIAKALGLAAWANERVESLNGVLIPTLRWTAEGKRNHSEWEVRRAGYIRSVSLTNRESVFLTKLATGKPTSVHRSAHLSLLKQLPELRPWIRLFGSESRNGRQSESEYVVPALIAARIIGEGG